MANLMASFNAGVSGLQSAQTSINTTSHNLANAQTVGYVRQQTVLTDSFYQTTNGSYSNQLQVGTGTSIVKTRQIRNEFLDGQYRMQVGRQAFYEQNQKAVCEIEDMLGELEGEEFRTSITDLKTALSTLAENPDSIVNKDQIVSVATQFVERAQVLQEELNTYQTSLNLEVQSQVDQINNLVSDIREYNIKIQKFEATGEDA
nr:flagellar basal body protein [Eubacterium sp.]